MLFYVTLGITSKVIAFCVLRLDTLQTQVV